MGLKEKIQRLIEAKEIEVRRLETQLAAARAVRDTLKLLPCDEDESRVSSPGDADAPQDGDTPKPGSRIAKAAEFLKTLGKPSHIAEIVTGIGLEDSKDTRLSLGGSLARWVTKGQVFIRTAPNTFGLKGMESPELPLVVPDEFGKN